MSNERFYTEAEVIQFAEDLGKFYKYDDESKTWRIETGMAPGMLRQTTKQLLHRLIDTPKRWEEQKKSIQ